MAYIVLDKIWDGFPLLEYSVIKCSTHMHPKVLPLAFIQSLHWLLDFLPKKLSSCKCENVKNTALLAARTHASLHAPVTVNDARPSWFFWLNALVRRCSRVISCCHPNKLGNVGKTHRSGIAQQPTDVFYLLTCGITLDDASWWRQKKDLELLGVKRGTPGHSLLRPPPLDITLHVPAEQQQQRHARPP